MTRCEGQNGQRDLGTVAGPRGRQPFTSEEAQSQCQGSLKSLPFACLFVLTTLAFSLEEAGVEGGSKSQLRPQTMEMQELC